MTRLSNATDSTLPDLTSPPRRYADPPALWAIVAVGSLAIHAMLLLGIRWFNIQVSLSQPETDTVPIEIVDAIPQENSTPTLSSTASSPDASSPLAQPTATLDPAAPNLEVQRQPVDRSSSAAIAPPYPDPNSASTATPTPQTTPNSSSRPQVNPTPQPAIPSPSPSSSGSSGSSELPSDESDHPGSSGNTGSVSDRPSPPAAPGNTDTSPINPPGQTGDNLPTASVDRQAAPSSYTASLVSVESNLVTLGDQPRDNLEQIAQPKVRSRNFASDPSGSGAATCPTEPEIIPYLGQTVELWAEIQMTDRDNGQVINTRIRVTSGSDAYDNFADCLLRSWEFRPASDQGQSPPSSEVVVQIKIELATNR
jgi:hypothetical protein